MHRDDAGHLSVNQSEGIRTQNEIYDAKILLLHVQVVGPASSFIVPYGSVRLQSHNNTQWAIILYHKRLANR